MIPSGSGGIAAALWHISRVPTIDEVLPSNLPRTAVQLALSSLQLQERRPAGPRHALLFGESGSLVVGALCYKAVADTATSDEERSELIRDAEGCCAAFERLAPVALASEEDEFLYGKAGYLFGCLILNANFSEILPISDEVLTSLARSLLMSGKELARMVGSELRWGAPLYWMWHDSPYLGAAHGTLGM